MNDAAMKKPRRKEPPVFPSQGKGAYVRPPKRYVQSRHLLKEEDNDIDGEQSNRHRIASETADSHASARATGSHTGAAVTQNRCDSFFIHGKGGTAFQAARHCDNRIARMSKLDWLPACFGHFDDLAGGASLVI